MTALISRTTVKALQRISGTRFDDQIDALLQPVTDFIESQTGRYFVKRTDLIETYDGTGCEMLVLRRGPVISIADVWEDARWVFGDDTKLDATTYYPNASVTLPVGYMRKVIYLDGLDGATLSDAAFLRDVGGSGRIFRRGRGNVKVKGTFGYETVPGDIQELAAALIGLKINAAGKEGMSSESLGDYSYVTGFYLTDVKALGPQAAATLSAYKDPTAAL